LIAWVDDRTRSLVREMERRGQRPKRDQAVWTHKTLPGPSDVIPRMGPDRCAS
jgi:hypothetical protein